MLEYIESEMPAESPAAFGLHPNAGIGFKLREGEAFCAALQALRVRRGVGGGGGGGGAEGGWVGEKICLCD